MAGWAAGKLYERRMDGYWLGVACLVTAYLVMAYLVMAYPVKAYIVMAYIVMT